MPTEIEKSLVFGGLLTALGVGGLWGFWAGVLAGGASLFAVALIVMAAMLFGGRA